jgi:hypothetical protein
MKTCTIITTVTLVVVALGLGAFLWIRKMPVSCGYVVAAEFTKMPADDSALIRWIEDQEGIVEGTVDASRRNQRLKLSFILSTGILDPPKVPDLDGACARLGYIGQTSSFSDCRGDGRDNL